MTQVGPRQFWTEIEDLRREWDAAGRPDRGRWVLTVDPTGRTALHLDGRPLSSCSCPASDQTAAAVIGTNGA